MKIAIAIPWFLPNRGGAEIGAWELARRLVLQGHKVAVITPRYRLDWPAREEIDGVDVRRYFSLAPSSLRRVSEAAHCLQAIPGVFHHLNDFQPDVVHIHYLFVTGYAAMLWSQRHHCPTIVTLVGNDVFDPYYIPCSFLAPVNRWEIHHAQRVVAASSFIRNVIVKTFSLQLQDIPVIPYGVDIGRFKATDKVRQKAACDRLKLPTQGPLIVTVQRLHERKGVHHYLDAAALVLRQYPECNFIIVGGGPERLKLEERCRALGIQAHVRFTGRVSDSDLPYYYEAADIFAFHTLHEGFGIVLLEAMACAKPIVTTRAGGTLDIVIPGENGEMVEPAQPDAFANAIVSMLMRSADWALIGQRNRQRVEDHFNWDKIAVIYAREYEHLLKPGEVLC